jgi:hypothetical protein
MAPKRVARVVSSRKYSCWWSFLDNLGHVPKHCGGSILRPVRTMGPGKIKSVYCDGACILVKSVTVMEFAPSVNKEDGEGCAPVCACDRRVAVKEIGLDWIVLLRFERNYVGLRSSSSPSHSHVYSWCDLYGDSCRLLHKASLWNHWLWFRFHQTHFCLHAFADARRGHLWQGAV